VQIAGVLEHAPIEAGYDAPPNQDWDAALLWNGGKRTLTVSSSALTQTQHNSHSPLITSIRGGAGGQWAIRVSAADAANTHSPFLLLVIPRRGTQLGNSVPTPLQTSTRVGVLGGNLGLAVVTAALLFLGASLFTDMAERLHRSNRVLQWAAHTAGKAEQAFSTAFAPMTWKAAAPPVRRVALAFELAVLLALTALIAAFLDPHHAPQSAGGEARGVGLFFGLLIALACVTIASALGTGLAARATGAAGMFQMRPGYLLLVSACAIVSRAIGFVPGFLFGLPAAWVETKTPDGNASPDERQAGLAAIAPSVAAMAAPLGLGLLCWALTIPTDLALRGLAHSSIPAALAGGLAAAVNALQTVLLLAVMLALWQALFEALPIGGLRGWTLFTRLRPAWAIVFVVAAFSAFHLLLNPRLTLAELPQNRALIAVIIGVAVYSAAALGAWLLFNAGRLRGQGPAPARRVLIMLSLTILIWLCLCALGAFLSAWSYLGSR